MHTFKRIIIAVIFCGMLPVIADAKPKPTPEEIAKMRKAAPSQPRVEPDRPRKLLVINTCNGFKHSSIPFWDASLKIMGEKSGAYDAVITDDLTMLKPENIRQFDAVCLNNTTKLGINPEKTPEICKGLMDFIHNGGGLFGIHAATDNFKVWPEAEQMMGGQFTGHPWTSGGTWAIKLDEPDHPLLKAFEGKNFKINDEIYRTDPPLYDRSKQRVLMSLDFSDPATAGAKGQKPTDKDTGIAWIKNVGKGRLFYSSLGHTHHITWNPTILQFYLDGIQWVMGDLKGIDATPQGNLSSQADIDQLKSKVNNLLQRISTYQYGQSREPLMDLSETIRGSLNTPAAKSVIERQLLAFLKTDATSAARDFAYRQLSLVGGVKSIPVLADRLDDPQSADMARYALQRIGGPEAKAALRQALSDVNETIQAGIITSLGQMQDEKAVPQLEKMVFGDNEMLSSAAISALGEIANAAAVNVLEKASRTFEGFSRIQVMDALLRCADAMLKDGRNQQALAIYQKLNTKDESSMIRLAALRGEILARKEKGLDVIFDVLKGDNDQMKSVAVGLINEIPGPDVTRAIAQKLPDLPIDIKVQMISALAERGDRQALPAVWTAAKSPNEAVRVEALSALSVLGNAQAVPFLAETAAASRSRRIQQTARESLYRLQGNQIENKIVSELTSADARVKVELIRAVGEREMKSAVENLISLAEANDRLVRREALKVLEDLAGAAQIQAMLSLMTELNNPAEMNLVVRVITAVHEREDAKDQIVAQVLTAYNRMKDDEAKATLLEDLFGPSGNRAVLPVLRTALQSGNDELKTAAIRGLSDWPTAAPLEDLKRAVVTSKTNVQRTLAFRGYVGLLNRDSRRPTEVTVDLYREAMQMADDESMKKMVLGELGKVGIADAIDIAKPHLENPALRQEAALAIIQIAETSWQAAPSTTSDLMDTIVRTVTNDTIVKRAKELKERIDQSLGFVLNWDYAGPYTTKNTPVDLLFSKPYPPERNPNEADWKPLTGALNPDNPNYVNLLAVMPLQNHVVYVRTRIQTGQAQSARLELGTDDGVQVWLNEQLVHQNNVTRPASPGDDTVKIRLKQGWNELMMKITQGSGQWGFYARLADTQGQPLTPLKIKP